jgi:hypothetical protein
LQETNTFQVDPMSSLCDRAQDMIKVVKNCLGFTLLVDEHHTMVHKLGNHVLETSVTCLVMEEFTVHAPLR